MQDIRIMSVVQSFDFLYKVHNCRIYVITCLLYDEYNIRFAILHRNFIQGHLYCSEIMPKMGGREISLLSAGWTLTKL